MNKKIVLCATQRCGSTFIVEDIQSIGVLGRPREYFIGWRTDDQVNWSEKMKNIDARATTENGVSSYKIMAKQLNGIEHGLASYVKTDKTGIFPHFAQQFEGSTFVYLKRENVVAQAVSREMARQTGINHATANADTEHFAGNLMKGYSKDYNRHTKYNFGSIRNLATSVIFENLLWQRFFDTHGITPVTLCYEDNVKRSKLDILRSIANAADLSLPDGIVLDDRKIVKLSNNTNADWEEQFFLDLIAKRFS